MDSDAGKDIKLSDFKISHSNIIQMNQIIVNQTVMWKIMVMYFDAQCNIPDKIDDNPEDDSKDRSSNPMEGIQVAEDSGMCASIFMPSIHVNWQLFFSRILCHGRH
jgi:hypothetical protein